MIGIISVEYVLNYSKFLHGIRVVDHLIYYSGSVYILFLQAESVIRPSSLWIHPSFGRLEAVELVAGGIRFCSSVVEMSFNGLRILFQSKSNLALKDKLSNNNYDNGSSSKVSDEENCALAAKAKKGKNEKAS
ncbi:Hypothetical predicted protein [Olea europaea subsp. europaea]|uniref:Uncharacterized protein n=1 Tax=Olea europaea subsp. europaea TaxID=158383 RepID=A0A8S0RD13_OLEEU|nr:Hypothetical predicted protein [Olea europaea subsp. europaea]